MKYKDLTTGMIFRNYQPPPYFMIVIQENHVWAWGFYDGEILINPLTKYDWQEYWEENSDEDLIKFEKITGSLSHHLLKQIFEVNIRREDHY